jgi:hypothetical protein
MRTRRRRSSIRVAATASAGLLGIAVGWAFFAGSAFSDAPSTTVSFYVYGKSNCTGKTEPVTIVFRGYANAARSANHLQKHTGWASTSGNLRYIKGHDGCAPQDWQRSTGKVTSHWHARGKTLHMNTTTDHWTLATAHHETVKPCPGTATGHVVFGDPDGAYGSGFDRGRETVYNAFGGAAGIPGHTGSSTYWGNSVNFTQCDGSVAGSDGTVYWINIPNSMHALP